GYPSGAGGIAMRLIVAAFALIIIVCVAAFGAILSQKTSEPLGASLPAAPAEPRRAVVTVTDDSNAPTAGTTDPAGAGAPLVMAQAARPAAPAAAPTPAATASPPVSPAPAATSCPGNPNALGVSRVVEIDTTGGPQFGFEHF